MSDNGAAFRAVRFATFIASRAELTHVHTRKNAPHTNGVRERGFGSLKYEHLYRHEITDGQMLAAEAEHYRKVFNWIRPHEALRMARPMEHYLGLERAAEQADEFTKSPNRKEPKLLPSP